MNGYQRVHFVKSQWQDLVGRRNEEKDLVRHKCSVRWLLSRRVDDIALAKSDLLRCHFCDWDIRRCGDRLGAVLITNQKRGSAALLDCPVRHA
jgi:hypothetical protein